MNAYEINFDGLVGPTHNYSGLSFGNVASMKFAHKVSNPKEAAKQGLKKMKFLHDLGVKQGVLPPQERPDIYTLKNLGFQGSDEDVIRNAGKQAPEILHACSSASSMWTANSATVSPSLDTEDGMVHFTPANLMSKLHRSLETATTGRILKTIFYDPFNFVHHDPLLSYPSLGDEGAANHTRLCESYEKSGVELFVYGRNSFGSPTKLPKKFPARQTHEASLAIARLHTLSHDRVVFAKQNPNAIDAGVFHNDVIAVGNKNLLFYHEKAFSNKKAVLKFYDISQVHLYRHEEKEAAAWLNILHAWSLLLVRH